MYRVSAREVFIVTVKFITTISTKKNVKGLKLRIPLYIPNSLNLHHQPIITHSRISTRKDYI